MTKAKYRAVSRCRRGALQPQTVRELEAVGEEPAGCEALSEDAVVGAVLADGCRQTTTKLPLESAATAERAWLKGSVGVDAEFVSRCEAGAGEAPAEDLLSRASPEAVPGHQEASPSIRRDRRLFLVIRSVLMDLKLLTRRCPCRLEALAEDSIPGPVLAVARPDNQELALPPPPPRKGSAGSPWCRN